MKDKGITFYLGIVIIILILIGGYITAGKVLTVLKKNPYIYGFLFFLLLGSIGTFLFSKYVRKEEGLKSQRIIVLSSLFLILLSCFLMIRNLISLVRHPVLAVFYFVILAALIVAWFITGKYDSRLKEIAGKKETVISKLSDFLWEAEGKEVIEDDKGEEKEKNKEDKEDDA